MKSAIGKQGNSSVLRIPAAAMKEAQFRVNQQVNIVVTNGRIVIEPAETLAFDLEKLISGISPENRHSELNSAGPVGKEAL